MLTTVSSSEKAAYVRAAGADEVINYRREDVVKRIADLTNGRGADRIIELNLSANAPLYDRLLAPGVQSLSTAQTPRWPASRHRPSSPVERR